jgi:DNA-binding FadR family transcriptional regulator
MAIRPAMPLHTIEPKRLYRQIADQVRALVEQGEFPPGTRLPAERELAQLLGVSRPSVREASPGRAAPVMAEPPLETIRAREVIESELAARAAQVMKAPQLRGLREAVALMKDEAAQGQLPTQGDRLFHLRIAESVGNAVLTRVVTELYDERHNPLFAQLGSHFENIASWRLAIAEHQAVIDAIAAHDAHAARLAMSRHLTQSHDRFTASWPQPAAPAGGRRRSATMP